MSKRKGTASLVAFVSRVCDREDNVYDRRVIKNILNMYMDECRKAILEGERIELPKIGTIIPEVRVHIGGFNLPTCNKEGGNPPYTFLKMCRNNSLHAAMNGVLLKNIQNGIYGLRKLPFSWQQMEILKKGGWIAQEADSGEERE